MINEYKGIINNSIINSYNEILVIDIMDDKLYRYNVKNNSKFVSCTRKTYNVKMRQERTTKLASWKDKEVISSTETGSEQLNSEPSMKTDWKNQAAGERFPNTYLSGNTSKNIGAASTTATLNAGQGYQIRCIKE